MPLAALAFSGGIGDIIRGSSLVGVLRGLGYEVDLILLPDYPHVRTLYDGAAQVRRVFLLPFRDVAGAPDESEEIARQSYDLTICKTRDGRLKQVNTKRRIWPSLEYRKRGDAYFCGAVARKLGWEGPLPHTFALHSDRTFDLPLKTVAMHPGCNPASQWKRWHGFAELAERLPGVAVVGSAEDLRVEGTYYQKPLQWPGHVRNFTGLNLLDTAALVKQCGMMISNDSGLMHLAVAMGVPTFGIFGATRPEKELMPYPHMHGIQAEPATDRQFEWHMTPERRADGMERLQALTPDAVLDRIRETPFGAAILAD